VRDAVVRSSEEERRDWSKGLRCEERVGRGVRDAVARSSEEERRDWSKGRRSVGDQWSDDI